MHSHVDVCTLTCGCMYTHIWMYVHSHVNAVYMYYRNVYNKCLKSENVKLVALLYWISSTVFKSFTGSMIVRFDDFVSFSNF